MEGSKRGIHRFAEWFQTLIAIPVFGIAIKEIVEYMSKKGAEKIIKRVDVALGVTVEETGKGFGDEILTREAIRALSDPDQQKVENFRLWLRNNNPRKADAFTLGIAKAVKAFEKQIKQTHAAGGGRTGRPLDKTETAKVEYDHSWSKNFFARLITRTANRDKDKFVFLEENFQSLVLPERKPLSVPEGLKKILESAEGVTEEGIDELTEGVKRLRKRAFSKKDRGFWREAISFKPAYKGSKTKTPKGRMEARS
jgi:hypothetical protein